MDLGASTVQGGLDRLPGFVRGIVLFTQVGQDHMGQPVMQDRFQQQGGVVIGKMSAAAPNALFQGPGVGPVDQHLSIVVGFENEYITGPQVRFYYTCDVPQICGQPHFGAVATSREPCRLFTSWEMEKGWMARLPTDMIVKHKHIECPYFSPSDGQK